MSKRKNLRYTSLSKFRLCVQRYNGNYKIKSLSCWDQFPCMAFDQLTYRESLRDIQASGFSWPLSADTVDAQLDALLFPSAAVVMQQPREPPDFVYIHQELRRKTVTLMHLWLSAS